MDKKMHPAFKDGRMLSYSDTSGNPATIYGGFFLFVSEKTKLALPYPDIFSLKL